MTVTEFIALVHQTMTQKERDECRMVWQGMGPKAYDIEPKIKTTVAQGKVLLMNP